MRYSASDKTRDHPAGRAIALATARRNAGKVSAFPRSSFTAGTDRYQRGGPEALADRPSRPDRIWNRIPEAIIAVRLSTWRWINPNSARGNWRVRFTDEEKYFVSEASIYRLLKAHDLITTSPAYIVIKAAEEFKDKTTKLQPALAN